MPTEPEEPQINVETKAERAAARRAKLEAAALRANLQRRKAQSRARQKPQPEAEKPCR